ncbi:MAG TPA: hypothetical protein VGF25_05955 [Thermoleophilaceae bacterium]|jgi:hypothetical protein
MGLFKNVKGAMGQAQDAMQQAQQMQQAAGGVPGMAGMDGAAVMADRSAIESQAHEQNRILSVGAPASALIRGHVDTGEQAGGNPIWIFDLEITPEGGASYGVQHREIVSSMAMGSYADGSTLACRVDPADQHKIAFGEKPFM